MSKILDIESIYIKDNQINNEIKNEINESSIKTPIQIHTVSCPQNINVKINKIEENNSNETIETKTKIIDSNKKEIEEKKKENVKEECEDETEDLEQWLDDILE